MSLLSEGDKKELESQFEQLTRKVKLHYFSSKQSHECLLCNETKQILDEVSALSDKIEVVETDVTDNPDAKTKFGTDIVPAIVLTLEDDKDMGIRWFGIPAGHEFMTLVGMIIDVGSDNIDIPDWAIEKIKEIDKPVDLKVFVTPTCPHCPNAVRVAHTLAYLNENVTASSYEASEFQEISTKYEVMAVPKVVINETHSFEGSLPFPNYIEQIMNAIK